MPDYAYWSAPSAPRDFPHVEYVSPLPYPDYSSLAAAMPSATAMPPSKAQYQQRALHSPFESEPADPLHSYGETLWISPDSPKTVTLSCLPNDDAKLKHELDQAKAQIGALQVQLQQAQALGGHAEPPQFMALQGHQEQSQAQLEEIKLLQQLVHDRDERIERL